MDLDQRIERLERRQRRMVWTVALGGVVALVTLGMADTKRPETTDWVDTKRLTIRDDNGAIRAFLTATPKGNVSLSLIDGAGQLCGVFGVTQDAKPSLELSHSDKSLRARLALEPDGKPYLEFYDAQGQVTQREVTVSPGQR